MGAQLSYPQLFQDQPPHTAAPTRERSDYDPDQCRYGGSGASLQQGTGSVGQVRPALVLPQGTVQTVIPLQQGTGTHPTCDTSAPTEEKASRCCEGTP